MLLTIIESLVEKYELALVIPASHRSNHVILNFNAFEEKHSLWFDFKKRLEMNINCPVLIKELNALDEDYTLPAFLWKHLAVFMMTHISSKHIASLKIVNTASADLDPEEKNKPELIDLMNKIIKGIFQKFIIENFTLECMPNIAGILIKELPTSSLLSLTVNLHAKSVTDFLHDAFIIFLKNNNTIREFDITFFTYDNFDKFIKIMPMQLEKLYLDCDGFLKNAELPLFSYLNQNENLRHFSFTAWGNADDYEDFTIELINNLPKKLVFLKLAGCLQFSNASLEPLLRYIEKNPSMKVDFDGYLYGDHNSIDNCKKILELPSDLTSFSCEIDGIQNLDDATELLTLLSNFFKTHPKLSSVTIQFNQDEEYISADEIHQTIIQSLSSHPIKIIDIDTQLESSLTKKCLESYIDLAKRGTVEEVSLTILTEIQQSLSDKLDELENFLNDNLQQATRQKLLKVVSPHQSIFKRVSEHQINSSSKKIKIAKDDESKSDNSESVMKISL